MNEDKAMRFSTYFSKQAEKPSGIYGRFIMSRIFDKGNLELNNFVKETLAIKKSDHILEIGCGTGSLLKIIADELENGIVEGIDFSKTMISKKKASPTVSIAITRINLCARRSSRSLPSKRVMYRTPPATAAGISGQV